MAKVLILATRLLIFLCTTIASYNSTACDKNKADDLVWQTQDIALQNDLARQRGLLESALRACPNHPEALNNLGVLSEHAGDFPQALAYYQQALNSRPDFANAWIGIGDVYQTQGQLPRALEAYLNACENDADAKQQVMDLLKSQRYQYIEAGQVLDKESLLALYDPARRQAIQDKAKACGLVMRAAMEPTAVFRNFQFATGKAELERGFQVQLKEIAAALQDLKASTIQINGHTDKQNFQGKSAAESVPLNQHLSEQRAVTIKQALIAQGVEANRIQTRGYGSSNPLATDNNENAYAQNRRVEIKVQ